MCDCFHIAFPNWHAASSGTGGRRLRGPEPGTEDNSICDEASQFTEGERPRPQGSSPVEEFPESDKYGDSDKECEAEHDPYQKSGKKSKKSGLGSIFDKRSTPKMSKLKEAPSPEAAGVIVKTAKDGGAEGLVYGGGGKDGLFIKEVVPESPASKNLHLKEGDQVLSATVYFDNIPYEDAIQILEHAQAYKVKLCLKRKPEITETEGAIDSDAIPEDEVHPPELREPGKKRRGDARISWPKFPTLGRGKKSRFTRSHSSSEADEQRKLELSPTTSDTESPIKYQDALKGKKKHKIKLPGLKRGRVSSSEDTDAQNIQTEEILSPECLESPSREMQVADTIEELKKDEDVKVGETETHKVELICLDSTLKTTDITAALVEIETPSTTVSQDGKKKKKERSELKLKILGKDKKHKAKSSPKRLKTLGASLDKTDDKENEKSQAVTNGETEKAIDGDTPKMSSSKSSQLELRLPKVEIDMSDVGIICKSTDKKGKGTEQKQAKTGFKLPKVGLGDITNEEIIKMDVKVEETKIAVKDKDDAYDKLSKDSTLPKREDIEIPGMEDISKITKDFKEPRAPLATISDAELQAETVQMSIDVDSVKEAVSKLPGYKLPKVDTCGMPIPDEITVIDANAQRISVKTPTKVKQESKSETMAFTEISKTTIKLPSIATDFSDIISETKVGMTKIETKEESKDVTISTKVVISQSIEVEKVQEGIKFTSESVESQEKKTKRSKATMPNFGISKPDIRIPDFGIELPKQSGKDEKVERTIFLPEDKIDVKLPDIKTSPARIELEMPSKDIDVKLKTGTDEQKDISVKVDVGAIEIKTPDKEKGAKFKMPDIGIAMPKVKGAKMDGEVTLPEVDLTFPDDMFGNVQVSIPKVEVKKPELEIKSEEDKTSAKLELKMPKLKGPEISLPKKDVDVTLPETKLEVEDPKSPDSPPAGELEAQGGKFKMPKLGIKMPKMKGPELDLSFSKNDAEVLLPEVKAKVDLPEAPAVDVTLGEVDVSIQEQKTEVKKPELDVQAPSIDVEGQGGKFKMPKLGIKMPKMKGPELDLSFPKKDVDVTLPEVNAKVDLPEAPSVDVTLGKVDVTIPEPKIEVKKTELDVQAPSNDIEGQGGKFKMPKLGVKLPKVKGPESDISLSKKDAEVTIPKGKRELELPDVPKVDVSSPEKKMAVKIEGEVDGQGSKFKMPKLGISMPKVKGPEIDLNLTKKEVEASLTEVKAEVKMPDVKIKEPSVKADVSTPEIGDIKVKTGATGEVDAKAGKYKMPKLGISMPKGPEIDFSLSKKDKDVKPIELKADERMSQFDVTVGKVDIPEAKIEIGKPSVESKPLEVKLDIQKPEIEVKPLEASPELEGQSGKFKVPRFTVAIPKVKAPEIDFSFQKKDVDVSLPAAKVEVEHSEAPNLDVEVKLPEVDADVEGQSGKFKLPKFGIKMPKVKGSEIDISLPKKDLKSPEIKADIKLPGASLGEVDVKIPETKIKVDKPEVELKPQSGKIKIKAPDIDVSVTEDSPSKFKMPSLGLAMPRMKAPEIDLSLSKKDGEIALPEAKAEATLPEVELSAKVEVKAPEGEPSARVSPLKFKMPTFKLPKFGGSIEEKDTEIKMDGFDVNVSVPQPEVDLPEVQAEVHLPEVEVKAPPEMVIEQPLDLELEAKFKKPRFSLPRFSFSKQNVQAPEVDVSAPEVNITQPEVEVEVKGDIHVKSPEVEGQIEGQGSRFKLLKFGIAMPKVSAPEIDLSLQKNDTEVTSPEAKLEAKLPSAEIKAPEVNVETKTKEGSPSKLKMPTFKLPKLGISISEAEIKAETAGVSVPKPEVDLPEIKAEVHLPEVQVKAPSGDVVIEQPSGLELDAKFKKPRFSLPRFSFSKQSVQAPEVDVSAPEVEVKAPSGDVEIEQPEIEVKGEIEVKAPEVEGQGSRFKLPRFGIAMPKISAPEIDLSLQKKDTEVTLPEAKVEAKLPDVDVKVPSVEAEIKAPEVKVETKTKEGSPSKLKMPTFKLPKFGISIPEAEIKAETADVSLPQPEVDLPEIKAEVHLPEAEVKAPSGDVVIEQPSDLELEAKFKKPRFSLPRFSFSKQSVQAPEVDVSAPEVNIPEAEGKVEVTGEIDIKSPEPEAQAEGQGSRFKLPRFVIAMPKISAPEIDLSIQKKDAEVTLPEAKVEAKFPEVDVKVPSVEAEIKAPEIKVETKTKEGSPSKLKMPTFKLPKFGISIPEAEIKAETADVSVPQPEVDLPEIKAEVHLPEAEVKAPSGDVVIEQPSGLELDAKFKKPRFSLPRFSFSKQSVQAPEVDVSAPEVEVKVPSGDVEIEQPQIEVKGEIEVKAPEVEGQGSRFKLPRFGIAMPKISAPEIDLSLQKKDAEVTLPEAKVEAKLPSAEIKAPEVNVETKTKEGSPSKLKMPTFKLPKLGISIPEAEIKAETADVLVPKPEVDLPEIKAEVHLPEFEIKAPSGDVVIEQPSGIEIDAKMKKPRFSLPRFSFSKQSVQAPEVDVSATEVNIPEAEGKVEVTGEIDVKSPEPEAQVEGQGSRFKLPRFGIAIPKISAPEIDLSLQKKDAEVTLPEAKVEAKFPEVDVKVPSVEAEIKAPEVKVETKTKEGSPSKLKMPTFKLPKFGISIPEAEIKAETADVSVPQPEVDLPEIKAEIHLPEVDIKAPSGDVVIEQPSGLEIDPKFKKPRFSLPRFSFSKQSVQAPEVDVSDPEVNIPEAEGKVEVTGEIDIKSPELEAKVEGQGSRFKLPRFGIAMPKISAPEIDLSISKKDVHITSPEGKLEGKVPDVKQKGHSAEAEIKTPEIKAELKQTDSSPSKMKMSTFKLPKFGLTTPSVSVDAGKDIPDIPEEVLTVQTDCSSIDIKVSEPEGKRSKFKFPSLGFSTPDTDVTLSKKEAQLPEVEIKEPSAKVEIKAPGLETSSTEGSPSKFKMPTFKLPKFGATAQIDGDVPDVNTDINVDVKMTKKGVAGEITDVKAEIKEPSTDTKTTKSWSLPRLSLSKPSVTSPDIDVNLPKVDITLPETKTEVQSPHGKEPISVEGQPTPEKKSRFSLPKISFSKQSSKDSETDVPEVDVSLPAVSVEVKQPVIEQKIDVEAETAVQGSRFKMPRFGISTPKGKGPEIDVSMSKKESPLHEAKADVPETKTVKVEESPTKFKMPTLKLPRIGLSVETPDADKKTEEAEVDATVKVAGGEATDVKTEHTGSKFNFGFSMPKVKGPEIDLSVSKKEANVNSPEAKVEVTLAEAEESDVHVDAKQKGSWSFPRFSFSKPTVNVESDVDVKSTLKEVTPDLEVKEPSVTVEDLSPAEPELKAKFSLPNFSFSRSPAKEPAVSANAPSVEVSLLEGEVKVKEPTVILPEVKGEASVEVKSPGSDKSKDAGGSPLKFKMPVFKMPKIGIATSVREESSNETIEIDETLKIMKEGDAVVATLEAGSPSTDVKTDAHINIKGPSVQVKTDVKATTPDCESPKGEAGSPSKFKLPTFKMPRLSFSKPMPEDEYTSTESKIEEDQKETESKEESKSPKKALPSFGEILKTIDVEFDVPSTELPKETQVAEKQQEADKKETKQEATKSPERTGWFKLPTFGLSSPTKEERKDKKSPVDGTGDELSPTCSIESSEAFADISSTMTSENIVFSLSSPTKVTVKYSDPEVAAALGEMHTNVVMSTTKTELFSVEPNLPEKVTILSSGVSSSSEDTVKLESGKIHVIKSNIQATPETQQPKFLTSLQLQSAEGLSGHGSWTVTDSHSSKSTFMESHVVTSSESKEVVITKQITRIVKTTEPISDETATSIKQLKDSVHTDKMRFFDGAEK